MFLLYNDQTYKPNNFDDSETLHSLLKFESFQIQFDTKETIVNFI